MFDWLKPEQRERRRKIKLDRQHLEARARRFLKSYLDANDTGKVQYYRAVEDITRKCQPPTSLVQPDLGDAELAESTSEATIRMIYQLNEGLSKKDQPDFLTDACATVAIAYHRAAGLYIHDEKMQELGTAAVHLLTMATSYMSAQKDERQSAQSALPFGEEHH